MGQGGVQLDWGECVLTCDSIKVPVRAADGHVYEKYAPLHAVQDSGSRVKTEGLGFRVQGSGFRVQGSSLRVCCDAGGHIYQKHASYHACFFPPSLPPSL
eukprot:3642516-Rhodomonas_salina.3